MTKQQKVGVCGGAVFGVCALALGWFLYCAYDACVVAEDGDPESGDEGLAAAMEKNRGFYIKSTAAKPFPSADTIASVKSNEAAYVKWRSEAIKVASRGDCPPMPDSLAPTVFKQCLYDEVTRMQKLHGGVAGHICAPGFLFGFDQYLGEQGSTPKRQDIPQLYAQLSVITNVVALFAKSGVAEVRKFERPELEDLEAEQETRASSSRGNAKSKSGKDAAVEEPKKYDFKVEFTARGPALVKVLNGLAKSRSFHVVSDFSFEHGGESLREKLKRTSEASAASGRPSSRRHRREQKEQEAESGMVTDPKLDPPMKVSMTLSVYDFGNVTAKEAATLAASTELKEGK